MFAVLVATLMISSCLANPTQTAGGTSAAPSICSGRPCPSFTVVNSYPEEGVEERHYDEIQVPAVTAMKCSTYSWALSQSYYHLSAYTHRGQNVGNVPLQMGVPVMQSVAIMPDIEERCSEVYTASFYVTSRNGEHLPNATNENVRLVTIPSRKVYVFTFSGFVRNARDRYLELREKLNALKLDYYSHEYTIANYDSPNTVIGRRNEIWINAV